MNIHMLWMLSDFQALETEGFLFIEEALQQLL